MTLDFQILLGWPTLIQWVMLLIGLLLGLIILATGVAIGRRLRPRPDELVKRQRKNDKARKRGRQVLPLLPYEPRSAPEEAARHD